MKIDLRMIATLVLGSVAGIGGGIVGNQWLQGGQQQPNVTPPAMLARQAPSAERSSSSPTTGAAERLASLEQRLMSMDRDRAQAPESAPSSASTSGDVPQDIAQLREAALNHWGARLQQHASEPIDANWSRSASGSFTDDLQQLASAQRFQLINTDCRSSSCSATVQWSDYGTAASNYTALLHQQTQLGCAREMVLPEPTNREAPYQASVLYDCSALRQPK